jgi:hypothetical protein
MTSSTVLSLKFLPDVHQDSKGNHFRGDHRELVELTGSNATKIFLATLEDSSWLNDLASGSDTYVLPLTDLMWLIQPTVMWVGDAIAQTRPGCFNMNLDAISDQLNCILNSDFSLDSLPAKDLCAWQDELTKYTYQNSSIVCSWDGSKSFSFPFPSLDLEDCCGILFTYGDFKASWIVTNLDEHDKKFAI